MIINNKNYDEKVYIMGILNVTPDSFSDGGKYNNIDSALYRAEQIVNEGGDIIDIGGESTRPGYTKISDEEEIERTAPIIAAISRCFDLPVSIDTYKSKVAEAALQAGAALVNDIWGFKYDKDIAKVTAKYGAACCLMHNRDNTDYKDLMADIKADIKESIDIALAAGVAKDKICIDPGIGFAKTYEQNLLTLKYLEELNDLGYPVLLGTSRKSVIGLTLDLPADQRLEGTIATSVMGVMKGCRFLRVHDVAENKRAVVMTETILNCK
ncbi:MAG: dihydropteroate synthase [Firmicutes bacterium]|nr:dihydropteroate synthase [Bacillota bacterium]